MKNGRERKKEGINMECNRMDECKKRKKERDEIGLIS